MQTFAYRSKITYHYLLFLSFGLLTTSIQAQVDTTYIAPFKQHYAARLYFEKNFFTLNYEESKTTTQSFEPNTPILIGLGFSWKNSSLSYSYGFDFMSAKNRGHSQSRSLQYHHYGAQFILDLYALKSRGFYRETKEKTLELFPELKTRLYGIFGQYVFNHRKFSFGAAFSQNKRQIRSAGSLLAGINFYTAHVNGAPEIHLPQEQRSMLIGPNVGYAYTWVINPHWYTSGSATFGLNAVFQKQTEEKTKNFTISPLAFTRFAIGYNAEDWTLNLTAIKNSFFVSSKDENSYSMHPGNIQVNFIYRFSLKKEISFLKGDLNFSRFKSHKQSKTKKKL